MAGRCRSCSAPNSRGLQPGRAGWDGYGGMFGAGIAEQTMAGAGDTPSPGSGDEPTSDGAEARGSGLAMPTTMHAPPRAGGRFSLPGSLTEILSRPPPAGRSGDFFRAAAASGRVSRRRVSGVHGDSGNFCARTAPSRPLIPAISAALIRSSAEAVSIIPGAAHRASAGLRDPLQRQVRRVRQIVDDRNRGRRGERPPIRRPQLEYMCRSCRARGIFQANEFGWLFVARTVSGKSEAAATSLTYIFSRMRSSLTLGKDGTVHSPSAAYIVAELHSHDGAPRTSRRSARRIVPVPGAGGVQVRQLHIEAAHDRWCRCCGRSIVGQRLADLGLDLLRMRAPRRFRPSRDSS